MPRVLVVEDSPTQAQQLAFLLEDAGFTVALAPDAESGHERLLREPFDAVLSDLLLPGDSGFDLCRRIKADPAPQHPRGGVDQSGRSHQRAARPGGGGGRIHDQGL